MAALRPRNDTKLERFCLENGRFSFFAVIFCAVSLRIVFQTFRSGNCSVFPQNLPNLSLRGGRVRPTRQSLTKRFAIPERTMVARNETEPWNENRGSRIKQGIHVFVIGLPSCFTLPCFVTGCLTFGFLIATAALRPRNDTKLRRFWVKTAFFARILRVLRSRQRRSAARSATDAACPLRVLRSRQRRSRVGRVSSQGISRFLPNFRRLHFAHTML